MTLVLPVKSASIDASVNPLFDTAEYFVFVNDENNSVIEPMPCKGGHDIARALIARDIENVVVYDLEMDPFVLLKSYGLKVYLAPDQQQTINSILAKFRNNELLEITPKNYLELFGEHDHHACA